MNFETEVSDYAEDAIDEYWTEEISSVEFDLGDIFHMINIIQERGEEFNVPTDTLVKNIEDFIQEIERKIWNNSD